MPGRRIIAVVLIALNALVWGFGATSAYADDPAAPQCPTAPAVYDGEDQVVRELRMQRRDFADACSAQHQDAIDTRAAIRNASDQAHDDSTELADAIPAARGTQETPVYTAAAQPQEGDQTVALSAADVTRIDSGLRAVNGAVWVGIGVLLLVPFALALNRFFTTT